MSLNGLDSPDVLEAHQVAIAEPGGWFLLKYSSRDSVELLSRGKGGVHEARTAIANYTEKSPLYGIIIYRRRKVLIKYIPEGISRVLLARTKVHWDDVVEKYSPCETTLEVTTPDGLNDTSLASSFPLHTATPSASSSRLDEINEDEDEEDAIATSTPTSQTTSNGSYVSSQRQRKDRRIDKSPPPTIRVSNDSSNRVPGAAPKAYVPTSLSHEDSGLHSISSQVAPSTAPVAQYANAVDLMDSQPNVAGAETPRAATTPTTPLFKPLPDVPSEAAAAPKAPEKSVERFSRTAEVRVPKSPAEQQTIDRPSTSATISTMTSTIYEPSKYDDDLYDLSRFDIKPKQKLGPRPVVSAEKTKRPTVASISSVPATYRPTSKMPEPSRPKSQGPVSGAVLANGVPKGMPAPPPIPDLPEYTPRPLSRGSIKSLPSHKSTAMTPDKIRLMKAVELRKKQMRKSNPQASTFVPPPDEEMPAVPSIPEPVQVQEATVEKKEEPSLRSEPTKPEDQVAAKKADSGISMEYEKLERRDLERPREIVNVAESKQQIPEPSPAAAKLLETADPQSPRVDTPLDIIGQFPVEDRPLSHIADAGIRDSRPNEATVAVATEVPATEDSLPGAESELESNSLRLHEQGNQHAGPTLPTSRHALPMDDQVVRNQSIDSRASEDNPANVPTIIMGDGSRPLSALIREARSEDSSESDSEPEERTFYESANSSSDLAPSEKEVKRKNSDLARRRRGYVEPIQIDADLELDSDEDFMDELQTATLQEAKPITVARSPVAHYFPRRPSNHSGVSDLDVNSIRTITVGDRGSTVPPDYADSQGRLSPAVSVDSPGHARSVSTVSSEKHDPMASFKRNVSSGISRRIQALAENSSEEKNLNITPSSSSRPTSPEVVMHSAGVNDPRQRTWSPPPVNSRTSSFRAISRHSSRISAYQSLMGSPVTPPTENSNTVWNAESESQGGVGPVSSVSVSARIVRPTPVENAVPTTDVETELHPSQLVVSSHKRAATLQSSVRQLQKIDTSPRQEEPVGSRTVSPTLVRGSVEATRPIQHVSKYSRSNLATSPTAEDFPVPPPSNKAQVARAATAPIIDDQAGPKEGTKTSRFFKRMSNINLGNKRRSTVAQSIASTESPASERGSLVPNSLPSSRDKPDQPPALTVGDLNIQFPDSLLWKRRIVEIDGSGYITFSISQAMEHQRGATKKYQLSDFRMPYIPDLDRQELPNSIMLDFVDGTTLQIACEDSMTHRQVTNVLKSYWKAWTAV